MQYIYQKPHQSIWLATGLLLLLSVYGIGRVLDVQLHDTYAIFDTAHLGLGFAALLATTGLIYWLLRDRRLVGWMTAVHVVTTVAAFVAIVLACLLSNPETVIAIPPGAALVLAVLVFYLSQGLFVTNALVGLLRGAR